MKTNFVVWTIVLSIGWTAPCIAQSEPRVPAPPAPYEVQTVPLLPVAPPRPMQGPQPGQPWNAHPAAPVVPVASFVESLRGNDAAINVVVGQGKLMTLRGDIAARNGVGVIAVGDPTILEFEVLPNPRMIRLLGRRAGITDLSITTIDGQTYNFEVQVTYDLDLLRARLRQSFPDAALKLGQIRDNLVIEGEARTTGQVNDILAMLDAYLASLRPVAGGGGGGMQAMGSGVPAAPAPAGGAHPSAMPSPATSALSGGMGAQGTKASGRIVNLLRVPGVKQVLLKVRVAELNRTATRQIGADILGMNPSHGIIVGTSIAGATVSAAGVLGMGGFAPQVSSGISPTNTIFGIFPSSNFEILVRALRDNQLLSILAEPNLMAMDGQHASFLAGGQFPVPVPQGGNGITNNVTVEFKDFGVQLDFIPHVLADGTIRLAVTPEVSSIDYSLGTTLVQGGQPVPGLDTRRATTTVELGQGKTLAIAGLMQVELQADTSRIPGLGDLPIIGAMFSNTSHTRTEKELVVLVTPYLVSPMDPCQVPATPGDEVKDPTDFEFFLMNRIENRNGRDYRATLGWDSPWNIDRQIKIQRDCGAGPVGFSQ